MGKRPSKPTTLKVLEGNRRGDPNLGKGEPKPRPIAPKKPYGVLDAQASAIWDKLVPKLVQLELITEIDGPVFAQFCLIWSRLRQVYNLMHKIESESGGKIRIKAGSFEIFQNKYLNLLKKYGSEFGLSPRGRFGLKILGQDDNDGFDLLD